MDFRVSTSILPLLVGVVEGGLEGGLGEEVSLLSLVVLKVNRLEIDGGRAC